jgi:predicted Fe-Mo cluster-binding NifX family protein
MCLMKTISLPVAAALFACGLLASAAWAQSGVGDPQGVARRPAKPKVISLSGKVLEAKTEPCENTSGRSPLGVHFVMKASDEKTVNIHLGPAAAVKSVVNELSRGREVKVEAFRTKKLEKRHYIARSVKIGDRTWELRDRNLRPTWAGAGVLKERLKRIAVTAAEPSLDAEVDPRFGRCAYFVIMDAERGTLETLKNTNAAAAGGGVGVESAQMIASKKAEVLLTGKCGPSALEALSSKGIHVVTGCSGTVRDAVRRYKEGMLEPPGDPKAAPRAGPGARSSARRHRRGTRRPWP